MDLFSSENNHWLQYFFLLQNLFLLSMNSWEKNRIFFVSSWIFFFLLKRCEAEWKKSEGEGSFFKVLLYFFYFHTWKTKQNLCFTHEKLFFSWKKEIHYKHISHTDFFSWIVFIHSFSHTWKKKKSKKKFHKFFLMIMQNFFFHQFSSNKHRKENCSDRN